MLYIRVFFLTTLALLALACAVNWFVDPYGMYWSPRIVGVNAVKPASPNRVRVTKAYRAPLVNPEVLLVGNSRIEMGVSPEHPAFGGQSVYNLGLPGAGVAMQLDYALNTIRLSGAVTRVILSVDFVDFLYSSQSLERWQQSGTQPQYLQRLAAFMPEWRSRGFRMQEKAALVFSLDSLFASVGSLSRQNGLSSSIGPRGQNSGAVYQAIIANEGIKPLFVQKIQELESRLDGKAFVLRRDANTLSPAFDALRTFLTAMQDRGIKVDVFINPYHFSYVMLLNDMGLSQLFLEWKELLVKQIDDGRTDPVQLWDFSGFGQEVMEPLPSKDIGESMAWFWEPAHYREQLGDKVIDKIMATTEVELGIRLGRLNIETVNAKARKDIDDSGYQWAKFQERLGR